MESGYTSELFHEDFWTSVRRIETNRTEWQKSYDIKPRCYVLPCPLQNEEKLWERINLTPRAVRNKRWKEVALEYHVTVGPGSSYSFVFPMVGVLILDATGHYIPLCAWTCWRDVFVICDQISIKSLTCPDGRKPELDIWVGENWPRTLGDGANVNWWWYLSLKETNQKQMTWSDLAWPDMRFAYSEGRHKERAPYIGRRGLFLNACDFIQG